MHTGTLMNAEHIVNKRLKNLKERVHALPVTPKLVIIRIGNDFASAKYVANKEKRCKEVGILSEIVHLDENVSEEEVKEIILQKNNDTAVTGVLLQLPIPKHLNEDYLTNLIIPEKDVDGFTISNAGKLSLGLNGNVPCTPMGIINLMKEFQIEIEGKDVLIINRSNIVGKPLAQLFLNENATVTLAHSRTKNLKEKVKNANIIVTAIGQAGFFVADDFTDGSVIIDVSINFDENGKMCGDVLKSDYDKLVFEKGCMLTPVPNGVGQMTVVELLEQTITAAE